MHVAVVGRDRDRAAIALHGIAVRGDDLAALVEREMAVAGVAFTLRGLNREIALAVDRDVEGRVGGVEAAFRQVAHHAGILHEAQRLRAGLPFGGRNLGDIFLEGRFLPLIGGGRHIGQIVRDHVHRAIGRDLVRQADEERIIHWGPSEPFWSFTGQEVCSRRASRNAADLLAFSRAAADALRSMPGKKFRAGLFRRPI